MSALACARCGGRGWTRVGDWPGVVVIALAWPVQCAVCGGRGALTYYALAKRLGVDPRTVRRVGELRARTSTYDARVVGELAELAKP